MHRAVPCPPASGPRREPTKRFAVLVNQPLGEQQLHCNALHRCPTAGPLSTPRALGPCWLPPLCPAGDPQLDILQTVRLGPSAVQRSSRCRGSSPRSLLCLLTAHLPSICMPCSGPRRTAPTRISSCACCASRGSSGRCTTCEQLMKCRAARSASGPAMRDSDHTVPCLLHMPLQIPNR